MAWLSGLTGKAESFLNSIDQKAASVLVNDDSSESNSSLRSTVTQPTSQTLGRSHPHELPVTSHTPFLSTQSKLTTSSHGQVAKQPDTRTSEAATGSTSHIKTKAGDQTDKKKTDTDEALFEFLNSPEPSERKRSTPGNSTRHSRQSSASSVISNKGGRGSNEGPGSSSTSGSSMVHVEMPGTDSRESPTDLAPDVEALALEDAIFDHSPSNSVHSSHDLESHSNQMTSSSMDLENRLLKNEVASLNQEMSSLVQRAKDSQTELVRLKQKMADQVQSATKSDHIIRELQNREQDLMEALGAKDSQLAILRVRLEEADREKESRQRAVEGLQSERERMLKDHSDVSGIHGQALDSLRLKLTEVEGQLQREEEAHKRTEQEAVERQTRLEEEQRGFTEALTAAEKKLTEEKAKVTEVTTQMKTMRSNLDSAKQELSEYKEKATRILQSKERLIASLREGSGASGDAAGVSNLEYDTVKQERDMFKEEIQQSRMTVENLRLELSDIEAQLQQESDNARETARSLEENLNEEKQRREDVEQELLKQKKELQYAIEEIHKQKTSFQSRLSDREAEIDKLRNQLATKSMSSTTEYELESRVRELTESLIQKQTMVEALSTEKNSLGLQLERLGQQYKDIQASSMRTNTTVIPVHEDDEVRHRLPMFMRETPTDTGVTKKVKRAVTTIDRFSIRLGRFLRRYPIARIFVIVYMALLHLWCMIILLTYQPEIHGPEHMKLPEPPGAPVGK